MSLSPRRRLPEGGTRGQRAAPPAARGGPRETVEYVVRAHDGEAVVAPYLVVIVTDARYFRNLTGNVFMFMPVQLTLRDLSAWTAQRAHRGARLRAAVRIYRQLI